MSVDHCSTQCLEQSEAQVRDLVNIDQTNESITGADLRVIKMKVVMIKIRLSIIVVLYPSCILELASFLR